VKREACDETESQLRIARFIEKGEIETYATLR